MKSKFALIALLVNSVAFSGVSDKSVFDFNQAGFDTMNDAAIAAETAAKSVSAYDEYAGAVILYNGKYFYTLPASNGRDDHFSVRLFFPQNAKIVALYHTHPAAPFSEFFSPDDIDVANQMNVTSYVGDIKDGVVIQYTPKVHYSTVKYSTFVSYTKGENVGKF